MNIKYLYVIPRMKFFSEGYRGRVMHALGVAEGISKINDENKVYLLGGSDLSKYFNDVPSNTELIEITESPGLLGYLNWQIKMYKEAKKRMISGDINHLIIRYNISSYLFIFLLSNICNQITKTIEVNYFAFQEYFNNHRNILNKIITFFEIKLVNNFSVLYVVSDKAANDSRLTKLKSKVVSIPNGVTSKPIIFNAKKKKENNKTRLLYLGTLMYYWDWEPIIKAFNNFLDEI